MGSVTGPRLSVHHVRELVGVDAEDGSWPRGCQRKEDPHDRTSALARSSGHVQGTRVGSEALRAVTMWRRANGGAMPEQPQLAFTLILRLEDGFRAPEWPHWTVIGQQGGATPQTNEPFKRYPITSHSYFAEQIGRVLFPTGNAGRGQRWVTRPDCSQLCVMAQQETKHTGPPPLRWTRGD